jgi:hypothetical protein
MLLETSALRRRGDDFLFSLHSFCLHSSRSPSSSLMADPRNPTISGRAVSSPVEVAAFTEEVIKRNMENALLPEGALVNQEAALGSTC